MSKAEERAKERYWLEPSNIKTQEKYAAYVEGYHQAEKDLELGWEDMEQIYNICSEVFLDYEVTRTNMQKIWKEALKRFKERKGEVDYG